jgi:hypothetical protein
MKHDISDLAAPNFCAAPLLVFYNRDDATARRFIWRSQMVSFTTTTRRTRRF